MAFYGNGSNITNIPSPSSLSTASGSAPSYSVRAATTFGGTAQIQGWNVSSCSYGGNGNWTINFSTSMPTSNYAAAGAGYDGGNQQAFAWRSGSSSSSAAVRVWNFNAGATNPTRASAIFVA